MITITSSAKETEKMGREIARHFKRGDIVAFTGELGSGKTTMIKGIVKHLTGCEATSPSFVLINEYQGKIPVFHFDLYRLRCKIEIETIGWEEYLDKGIVLIEWADKITEILPKDTIFINLSIINDKRKITIKGLERRIKNDKQRKSIKST
ncbi:MAG: tRNA (adenosine(37)-N6)-threonylcarbamoyltransferase complex ATPase subunit type 1 TsaE [Candidatus Omnitrophica bacterium]|nr:tRNA (adenosine(37)-N6)-threonylcarbamoyltransferase complex ATPase subunit type 1 TsaE [Candidatus Omnitrophota bacterium]MCM8777336.1 tRNA (adenosine(37)-N6)-threonylcarbamoyltransferase complex ATPase subunit type 1 TsaE [Candidatus Omnitrophota bacterium]